jgi:hypothetical protein
MNWTTEFPTKPGTYWVRKHTQQYHSYMTGSIQTRTYGAEIVEVDRAGGIFWMLRTESWEPAPDTSSAEWYGPIDPPE